MRKVRSVGDSHVGEKCSSQNAYELVIFFSRFDIRAFASTNFWHRSVLLAFHKRPLFFSRNQYVSSAQKQFGQKKPRLFIANKLYSSWSLRPWLLLKLLDIEFEEIMNPFSMKGYGSDFSAFQKFSPSGKVPCLHDNGMVIWDSLAIVEYLAEKFETVWPKETEARVFARCAAAEMHAGFNVLREQCSMNLGLRVEFDTISVFLKDELERLQELWMQGFDSFGGPFLAGKNFKAVDAFFAPVCFRVQTYNLKLNAACMKYIDLMLSLPAMALWQREALAETWTEPGHESLPSNARILRDLRKESVFTK
jgi:glutathione S-transferase